MAVLADAGAGAFVRFRNVRKSYDGVTVVVKDLNLSLRKGEFLTLLGPSGSGKTTTLMMLAGFERPTSGEIELEGRSLARLPPYQRDFGMVFQDYSLFPHLTVAQNVGFPLSVRREPAASKAKRVAEALDMVKLAAFSDRYPMQLSGGQQQRVALARALVFGPRLVLMDEPLGALDKQLREELQLEIKHIQQSLGITAVYVTHDQHEALTLSDRIAVFHDGGIIQIDTPKMLYERPGSAFVANFIGESNRLSGRLTEVSSGLCQVELADGVRAFATLVDPVSVGERVVLSVRPERVRISDPGSGPELAAGPGPRGVVAGVVEEIIYQGDHVRLRLTAAGAVDFVVKFANDGGRDPPGLAEKVLISWAAEDCRAFAGR